MKFSPVDLPNRTVIVNNKGKKYVYLTQEVSYSPDLKCSRPKRIAIGKLSDDGKLIPNKNYIDLFGETIELKDACERSDFVSIGPHFIAQTIAIKTKLQEVLYSIFDKNTDKILDIAVYMMMTENNIMQYFEDYGYCHSLFNKENFTDGTIGSVLSSMKVKDMDTFISAWVKLNVNKDIYIAYDSTNMNTVAGNLEMAEYGHAKDDEDLPQINLSIGYDQTDMIPLFYELYPGSIIDNTECEKMVERAMRYGCEKIGFILDRGYFSQKNIQYFEGNGFDYILMMKGNAKCIKEILQEYRAVLKNGYSYYLEDHKIYGMTVEKKIFGTEKIKYVHIYYDGIKAEEEKIAINERYIKMDKKLEEKKGKKIKREEDVKSYEKYYKLGFDENGYFQNYQKKDGVLREMLENTGIFVIVTSKKMGANEALETYRDRDAVEKIFRMEKSYLGNDVFRVHTGEHLESKIFISFIALIIRNEIYKCMKRLYKQNRKEYTVPKVLREIDKLGLTKLSDDRYHLRYNLTGKQKKILKELGINEQQYKEFAEEVKEPLEK